MALIEIEVTRPEAPQTPLDRRIDVLARESLVEGMVGHGEEAFAREHVVIAIDAFERGAPGCHRCALPVDVGSVEERDAEVERTPDERGRLALSDALAEGEPGPESDRAHCKAAPADPSMLHGAQTTRSLGRG